MAVIFKDNRGKLVDEITNQLAKGLLRTALKVERSAKQSMIGGGKPHVPSAAGDPPRVDTGVLRSSITHELKIIDREPIARIGTNVTYGRDLELGTSQVEPRPWLRPALARVIGR